MSREKVTRPPRRRAALLPRPGDPHPTVESTASAAARLGIDVRRVRDLVQQGCLTAFKTRYLIKAPAGFRGRTGRTDIPWLLRERLHVLSDSVTAYQLEQIEKLQQEYQQKRSGKSEAPPRAREGGRFGERERSLPARARDSARAEKGAPRPCAPPGGGSGGDPSALNRHSEVKVFRARP
jgi:hypothetical protein